MRLWHVSRARAGLLNSSRVRSVPRSYTLTLAASAARHTWSILSIQTDCIKHKKASIKHNKSWNIFRYLCFVLKSFLITNNMTRPYLSVNLMEVSKLAWNDPLNICYKDSWFVLDFCFVLKPKCIGKFLSENPLTYARSSEILGMGFLNLTLSAWEKLQKNPILVTNSAYWFLCPRDDNADNVTDGERKNGAWPVDDKQSEAHVAPCVDNNPSNTK